MKLQKGGGLIRGQLRSTLFFLLLLGPFSDLFPQEKVRDSLIEEWESDRPEQIGKKIELLNPLARHFYSVDPDSAEHYAQEAKALSEVHDHRKGLEESLNLIGITHYVRSDHVEAMRYWEKLLKLRRERDDKKGIADIQNNLGLLYKKLGNQKKALEAFQECLSIRDSLGLERQLGSVMNNLGILYYSMGELDKARGYYEKALRFYKEYDKGNELGGIYNNIALIHRQKGKLDSSLLMARKALEAERNAHNSRKAANAYINLGLTFQKKGSLDSANHYFKKARRVYADLGAKGGEITAITNLAGVFLDLKAYRKARKLSLKAYRMSDSIGSWAKQKGASAYVARASAAMGDSGTAYRFQKIHDRTSDSLMNKKKSEQIARIEARYNAQKRKKELEKVKAKRRKADLRWQQVLFLSGGGGLVLLLFLLFFILRYREKRKSNRLLEEQKKELIKERDEKELLLKEVNHRVKNNLQLINSLLNLQGRRIEDEELRQLHIESQNRIRSMGILHERIYKASDLEVANLERFVKDLMEWLKEAYGVTMDLELKVDIDQEGLKTHHFTPLALIINELLSNAMKYAFQGREKGNISVTLKPEKDHFVLDVTDDGIGLSASPEREVESSGLGLDIVRSMAEQIGGDLAYWEREEGGTQFRIDFSRSGEEGSKG